MRTMAKVTFDYSPTQKDELKLVKGETVEVLKQVCKVQVKLVA